jgi:hypothetical protein
MSVRLKTGAVLTSTTTRGRVILILMVKRGDAKYILVDKEVR